MASILLTRSPRAVPSGRLIGGITLMALVGGLIVGTAVAQMPSLELGKITGTGAVQPPRRATVASSTLPAGSLAMDPKGPYLRATAAFLGLAPGQVVAELWAGKSLVEIGQAQGKSRADLAAAILAAGNRELTQAVEGGRLSTDRAELLLQRLKADVDHVVGPMPVTAAAPLLPIRQ